MAAAQDHAIGQHLKLIDSPLGNGCAARLLKQCPERLDRWRGKSHRARGLEEKFTV
jgi:hypothetical protein